MDVDQLSLDRQALDWAGEVIAKVRPEHLGRPTPCGAWTLRELLGHMIAHNHGFAAAALGTPVGGEVWDSLHLDGDVQPAYATSAAAVTEAFAGPSLPSRIDVYGYGPLPVAIVVSMHIVDFVVHGWDVARSIGLDRMPDEALSDAAYKIMLRFPTDRPNKAFGVMMPVAEDAPIGDRLMAYVGRDPRWSPAPPRD